MSDDTPTQAFTPQPSPASGTPPEEPKKRGALIPILITVGALLLIGVIVLGSLLLGRDNSGSPQAAATDSATNGSDNSSNSPSATPVPVPTPTVTVTVTATAPPSNNGGGSSQKPNGNNVLITQYTISPMTVDCSSGAPADAANLSIHWKSENGDIAYFGVNAADAQTGGMGWNLPASGSDADFPSGYHPYTYPCGSASEEYTVTVAGNGSKQSLQLTVKRK